MSLLQLSFFRKQASEGRKPAHKKVLDSPRHNKKGMLSRVPACLMVGMHGCAESGGAHGDASQK